MGAFTTEDMNWALGWGFGVVDFALLSAEAEPAAAAAAWAGSVGDFAAGAEGTPHEVSSSSNCAEEDWVNSGSGPFTSNVGAAGAVVFGAGGAANLAAAVAFVGLGIAGP